MQIKKEISFILVFAMLAALLTGCSDISTITLKADGSGSYEEIVTMSKNLWDMSIGTTYDDQSVVDLYRSLFPDAKVTVAETVVNGAASKEIRLAMDFKNESDFRKLMDVYGTSSTKFNENYYSRSSIFVPTQNDPTDTALPDDIDDLFGDNEALSNALMAEMEHIDIKMTITFPYTITETNGNIQQDGKTVVWELKQGQDEQTRYYATFKEQDSKQAPTFSGAKNGKYYNTAVSLYVNSENLLDKVTVNGQATQSDLITLIDDDTYNVTALDKNGNTAKIKFNIDMKKPVVKGVKNGKVYIKKRTIRFSDQDSGIKKATLNSKKIKSGTKISKKGSYILLVTDKANNTKTVRFKIK